MRKKLSPWLVLSWLVALSMIVYAVMLYVHVQNMQKIQGESIRLDIFRIHELCGEISPLAEGKTPSPTLHRIAGELLAMRDGTGINADYKNLCEGLAADLMTANHVDEAEQGGAVAALLWEDIGLKTNALLVVTEYIIEQAFAENMAKMNVNYFDMRVISSPENKRISTAIAGLLP